MPDEDAASKKPAPRESWWAVGDLSANPHDDPVAAMLERVRHEQIEVDAMLVPGDVCHKASSAGFKVGWDRLRLLASELGGVPLVGTLGNHDCSSRSGHGDPFASAKRVAQFPVADEGRVEEFWSRGSTIVPLIDAWNVVVINTARHHYSEAEAKTGTFQEADLTALSEQLEAAEAPVKLAMLHHHPILHSSPSAGLGDALLNGDALLEVLSDHGVRLVIHGHRHEPRMRRGDDHDLVVFAAGSFACLLTDLGTVTRNLFHVATLTEDDGAVSGQIRSWEFNRGYGWFECSPASARIPHVAHFSSRRPDVADLVASVREGTLGQSPPWWPWGEAVEATPGLLRLTPRELDSLNNSLERDHGIRCERGEFGDVLRWTAQS